MLTNDQKKIVKLFMELYEGSVKINFVNHSKFTSKEWNEKYDALTKEEKDDLGKLEIQIKDNFYKLTEMFFRNINSETETSSIIKPS